MRNQWLNAPQEIQQLEPDRSGLRHNAHPAISDGRGTSRSVDVAGREVMVNACGVAMTRLQEQIDYRSFAPLPVGRA